MQQENVVMLNLDLLLPNPHQPRKNFNENSLKELALSIREYGVLNPILVRKKEDKYEIIAGERRCRAAKLAGLTEVPAIIREISDDKISEIALIENLQRENITPIEEAKTYQEILKTTNKTEKELSEMIGKSQPFIANKLRLLNLPENIQNALINRKISERHARSLLTIKDKARQTELLEKIMREKLSVKELDNIINENKISDEEIASAVNNIMTSLNESDVKIKKEEKESDNMNNGSFFPNFNNPQDANNTTASLNSMNMQTMENNAQGVATPVMQQPMPTEQANVAQPIQTPVVNQPDTLPQVEIQNMDVQNPIPEQIMPNINSEVSSPIPEFGVSAPTIDQPVPSPAVETPVTAPVEMANPEVSSNQVADIPLFSEPEFNQPTVEQPVVDSTQVVEPSQEIPSPVIETAPVVEEAPTQNQMVDTPLFNNEASVSPVNSELAPETTNLNESFYEVPVNISPVIEETGVSQDKFTEVQQLLSSNGIEYKAYSNETGHCIIIEL